MANPTSQPPPPPPPNPPPSDQRSGFERLREDHQVLINLLTQISAHCPIRATVSAADAILSDSYKMRSEESAKAALAKAALAKAALAKAALAKAEEKCSALQAQCTARARAHSGKGALDEAEEKCLKDLWEAAKTAAEEYMDAAKRVAKLVGGVDFPNVGGGDYDRQVAMLVEDVNYIHDHVGSLESSANRDRANEFLIDIMDAAFNRTVLDFMPDSENLKNLLHMVAKLKLWIPREKDDTDTSGPTMMKKKKKKGSAFVSRKETENVAADIVNELFDLKCREWGMSGLLNAYNSLPDNEKLCLLCFSAFPCEVDRESDVGHAVEKSLEIKNRTLIHLWVGERFIDSNKGETIEEIGEEILRDLTEAGFIEPGVKKGPRTENGLTGSSRMHPFVHSFVMALAKRAGFFEFGEGGKISPELGISGRACLLKSKGKYDSSCQLWGSWANETDSRWRMKRFETVQTLFNVDESIIDVKSEWFSKMKHLKVLHLGRWSARTTEHIEVEDQKFLKEVTVMKQMRLLSLQGVSTILNLPDSVTELENLVILDLRECQSLEELPYGIGLLKNLTHLDVTNCHLLTKLPKGVRKLSKLEVLKGFVVSEAKGAKGCKSKDVFAYAYCWKDDNVCTLKDLKEVKGLRELSIVVNREKFPNADEVQVFKEMSNLRKLRISWEGSFSKEQGNGREGQESSRSTSETMWDKLHRREGNSPDHQQRPLNDCSAISGCVRIPWMNQPEVQSRGLGDNNASLEKIEKLELLCMPDEYAPTWLNPDELIGLEKLYIKGGKLKSLPGDASKTWNVKTLRLKYMPVLKITWAELREMFPKMTYLENYECKEIEHFPCDQGGVWMKENELH